MKKHSSTICYSSLESPLGPIFVASSPLGICNISIAITETEFLTAVSARGIAVRDDGRLEDMVLDLHAYLKGEKRVFDGHRLDLSVGTEFQQRVWRKLLEIPYGETRSYRWLAEQVGTRGFRAVGGANGRNPLPVIIPCHRVINSDGSIGGYSGGVWIKEWLLRMEMGGKSWRSK